MSPFRADAVRGCCDHKRPSDNIAKTLKTIGDHHAPESTITGERGLGASIGLAGYLMCPHQDENDQATQDTYQGKQLPGATGTDVPGHREGRQSRYHNPAANTAIVQSGEGFTMVAHNCGQYHARGTDKGESTGDSCKSSAYRERGERLKQTG